LFVEGVGGVRGDVLGGNADADGRWTLFSHIPKTVIEKILTVSQ
jgi:hypothetical protein